MLVEMTVKTARVSVVRSRELRVSEVWELTFQPVEQGRRGQGRPGQEFVGSDALYERCRSCSRCLYRNIGYITMLNS